MYTTMGVSWTILRQYFVSTLYVHRIWIYKYIYIVISLVEDEHLFKLYNISIIAISNMEAPAQQYYSRVKAIREQPGETTIMFVGAPGAGKSSLINTLVNVVDSSNELPKQEIDRCVPTAPPDLMGGHTMMREPVKLTDTLTIFDNRGWQDWGNEVALQEFCAQISKKT